MQKLPLPTWGASLGTGRKNKVRTGSPSHIKAREAKSRLDYCVPYCRYGTYREMIEYFSPFGGSRISDSAALAACSFYLDQEKVEMQA